VEDQHLQRNRDRRNSCGKEVEKPAQGDQTDEDVRDADRPVHLSLSDASISISPDIRLLLSRHPHMDEFLRIDHVGVVVASQRDPGAQEPYPLPQGADRD
jgi:hypothetical protein